MMSYLTFVTQALDVTENYPQEMGLLAPKGVAVPPLRQSPSLSEAFTS